MDSAEATITKIRAELCDELVHDRVLAWGPAEKSGGTGFVQSWTDSICKDIGTARHYITCVGDTNGQQCLGRWSRREQYTLSPGLHCTFGSHVMFDGVAISEVPSATTGRDLQRLRHLWAEHVLNSSNHTSGLHHTSQHSIGGPILAQGELDKMRSFLQAAITKSEAVIAQADDGQKALGKGTTGRSGVTEAGIVMKRDSGDHVLGNSEDHCYREPGGFFRSGDLEVWMAWHGWSDLSVRDGRWRPGYDLELLLGLFATVIDYGTNRKLWRAKDMPWVIAAEWVWVDTPNDVHFLLTEGIAKDLRELFRREVSRVKNLAPSDYSADNSESREAQYPLLLDRAGEFIARHTVGQPLLSDRGYIIAWVISAPNDIIDYERDVLGGETNNLVRGLTSPQQIVDAAYMILLIIEGAYMHKDFDMVDAIIGTSAFYIMYWRYNTPKQFKLYQAISIRDGEFGSPAETTELVDLVQRNYPVSHHGNDTYGKLYDKVACMMKKSYWGCTCDSKPRGHDVWKMLGQVLEEEDSEALEEQMHIEFSHLGIGASRGDIRCECGLDLACYEGFVRFYHPDTGLVSRLHHRTSTLVGNSLAE